MSERGGLEQTGEGSLDNAGGEKIPLREGGDEVIYVYPSRHFGNTQAAEEQAATDDDRQPLNHRDRQDSTIRAPDVTHLLYHNPKPEKSACVPKIAGTESKSSPISTQMHGAPNWDGGDMTLGHGHLTTEKNLRKRKRRPTSVEKKLDQNFKALPDDAFWPTGNTRSRPCPVRSRRRIGIEVGGGQFRRLFFRPRRFLSRSASGFRRQGQVRMPKHSTKSPRLHH